MPEIAFLPSRNYLYDLRIRAELDDESSTAWIAVTPELVGRDGALHAGLLVAFVDGAAGRLAVRAALPRVIATSHIGVQTSGPIRGEALVAEAMLLRKGRRSIAISVALSTRALAPGSDALAEAGPSRAVGRAIATFDAIDSSFDPALVEAFESGAISGLRNDAGFTEPFHAAIGLREVDADAGVFELPLSPYVANHVSALQGGIFGALVEAAAESACRVAVGAPVTVLDLSIPYLAMGKRGPFRTGARIVRATQEHAVAEIDIVDVGQDDRLLTRATAVACRTKALPSPIGLGQSPAPSGR